MTSALFKDLPISINSVHISGNVRTKSSFLHSQIKPSLQSNSLSELYSNLQKSAEDLRKLNVYDSCDLEVEILSSDSDKYNVNVNVSVNEKGLHFLKMETFVRNSALSNDVGCEARGFLRNTFGHGEMTSATVSTSSSGSKIYSVSHTLPLLPSLAYSTVDLSLKKNEEQTSYFTSFNQINQSLGASITSNNNRHKLGYEFSLRQEIPATQSTDTSSVNASREIIDLCDQSTKSSLTYSYSNTLSSYSPFYTSTSSSNGGSSSSSSSSKAKYGRPARSESCLLTGPLATHNAIDMEVEAAGMPGSVRFLKADLTARFITALTPTIYQQRGLTLILNGNIGALVPLRLPSSTDLLTDKLNLWLLGRSKSGGGGPPLLSESVVPVSKLSDRFFAGGPMSLKGFSPYGIGPRAAVGSGGTERGDALGGDFKSLFQIMLTTPILLPRIVTLGGRLLLFANYGNVSSTTRDWNLEREIETARVSVGCGISLPLGGPRVDITYAVPLRKLDSDLTRAFQIGLSIESGAPSSGR